MPGPSSSARSKDGQRGPRHCQGTVTTAVLLWGPHHPSGSPHCGHPTAPLPSPISPSRASAHCPSVVPGQAVCPSRAKPPTCHFHTPYKDAFSRLLFARAGYDLSEASGDLLEAFLLSCH